MATSSSGGGRRRGGVPNQDGLERLGSQMGKPDSRVANEDRLRALGQQMDEAPAKGRRRRSGKPRWSVRRKVLTAVVAVVVLALVAVGGTYGYARYRFDQVPKVHIASEHIQDSGQPFNMLVVGSDSRVGVGGSAFGSSSVVTGQRSDVLMVWHVDPATKQITILSIPRDTLVSQVDTNDLGTYNRVNSAFNNGPNQLVQVIENNFGIPINHVIQVDFAGFQGAVDALGGVYMDFPYPAKDAYSGLDITTPGCQLLNGAQALAVARSRHYEYEQDGYWQYDGTSDFGRIQRQDAFLRSLINAAKSKINPLTLNAFIGSLPQGLVIDDGFTLNELLGLALDFRSFSANSLVTETLPTTSIGYVSPWGDVLFVDQPAAQQMLVSVFGDELVTPTTPPPNTSLESVPPPVVTVPPVTTAPATTAPAGTPTTTAPTTTTTAPPSFDPTACTPG